MGSSTLSLCWGQSGEGQLCKACPPAMAVSVQNGPSTQKSFRWTQPCRCPLWQRMCLAHKHQVQIVLTVLQPKKGCNLSEVTWQVKDELGSKPRSVDPQAQASAKFFCSQRLKSCFLLRVAKPARTCILCARHTSNFLACINSICLKILWGKC